MYLFSKVCVAYGSSSKIFHFFMVCFRSKLISCPILFLLLSVFKACITYFHSWFDNQANINELMRISYIHLTVSWAEISVVAQNQVGMDLIYHDSTCDISRTLRKCNVADVAWRPREWKCHLLRAIWGKCQNAMNFLYQYISRISRNTDILKSEYSISGLLLPKGWSLHIR